MPIDFKPSYSLEDILDFIDREVPSFDVVEPISRPTAESFDRDLDDTFSSISELPEILLPTTPYDIRAEFLDPQLSIAALSESLHDSNTLYSSNDHSNPDKSHFYENRPPSHYSLISDTARSLTVIDEVVQEHHAGAHAGATGEHGVSSFGVFPASPPVPFPTPAFPTVYLNQNYIGNVEPSEKDIQWTVSPQQLSAPSQTFHFPSDVAGAKPNKKPRRYQCPYCPSDFDRNWNLKTHMRKHDPAHVRPYLCLHVGCGKRFDRKHDLSRHRGTHSSQQSIASAQRGAHHTRVTQWMRSNG